MTDKQIIIDVSDCSELCGTKCHILMSCTNTSKSDSCSEMPNCYYKQLKRKEQECEELKKIIDEAKNSKLDLKSFLVGEAVQNEYEEQLDQIKEEKQGLIKDWEEKKNLAYEIACKNEKLKQTLTEIKEIAERGFKHSQCNCGAKADLDLIIQKISECEVK